MFSFKPEFISARVSQTVSTELHLWVEDEMLPDTSAGQVNGIE